MQLPNVTRFTLQTQANPAFTVYNPTALDSYMDKVGGYAVQNINGTYFAAKLDNKTWTKFADGTPVADPSKFETMVHMPRLYFKADGASIQLSPVERPDFRYFDSPEWVAAYKISFDGALPHSRPGVAPQVDKTISEFWNEAQRLGIDWGLANYQFQCHIYALYQAIYGNLNSQAIIGVGFRTNNWQAALNVPMGLLVSLGDGSGSLLYEDEIIGAQYPVKLFGFEDLWGKSGEFRSGLRFFYDNTLKAIVYSGNRVSNSAEGRIVNVPVSNAAGEYIRSMILGQYWDMLPSSIEGADANSFYCDACYMTQYAQILCIGARASAGLRAGLMWTGSINDFDGHNPEQSARLAFYGSPTIIPGAEFVQLLATRRSMPAPEVPADDVRTDETDNSSIDQGNER